MNGWILAFLLACAPGTPPTAPPPNGPEPAEEPKMSTDPKVARARARVEESLAGDPFMKDALISRFTLLDVGPYLAFSVVPKSTGRAGEVVFLVSDDRVLSSKQPSDFDQLMADLGVGTRADAVDIEKFVDLFLRMRLLVRGVVLDSPDGHPLLRPGQIPEGRFELPSVEHTEAGTRYRFWMFGTDSYEPGHYEVLVAPDGTTTYRKL